MQGMRIPEEIIQILEAHLEPKETVRAINALNELLFDLESRSQAQQLCFMEELKVWLSTELATKSELANIEVRIREDISTLRERVSAIEEKMESLATREEVTKVAGRLESIEKKMESLATKESLSKIEGKMESLATKEELAKMDRKFTVMWMITLFVIILLNQDALRFIAGLIGLVK